jgi:hypothetical protein
LLLQLLKWQRKPPLLQPVAVTPKKENFSLKNLFASKQKSQPNVPVAQPENVSAALARVESETESDEFEDEDSKSEPLEAIDATIEEVEKKTIVTDQVEVIEIKTNSEAITNDVEVVGEEKPVRDNSLEASDSSEEVKDAPPSDGTEDKPENPSQSR